MVVVTGVHDATTMVLRQLHLVAHSKVPQRVGSDCGLKLGRWDLALVSCAAQFHSSRQMDGNLHLSSNAWDSYVAAIQTCAAILKRHKFIFKGTEI